jgi:hypothetical protein
MVLALWLAHPGMEVTGDSTCPTPAEVQEQLATLDSGPGGETTARSAAHHANISGVGSSVHVELLSLDGQLVAERTLERAGSCGDVAEAVAVIISAWEATFNPNLATPVVEPPNRCAHEPVSVLCPREAAKSPPSRPTPFDAGLAAAGLHRGRRSRVWRQAGRQLVPAQRSLGLDVALSGTSTHTQSIAMPAVAAQWTRAALSAGPTYRLRRNATALDVHAGSVGRCCTCKAAACRRRPRTPARSSV